MKKEMKKTESKEHLFLFNVTSTKELKGGSLQLKGVV